MFVIIKTIEPLYDRVQATPDLVVEDWDEVKSYFQKRYAQNKNDSFDCEFELDDDKQKANLTFITPNLQSKVYYESFKVK